MVTQIDTGASRVDRLEIVMPAVPMPETLPGEQELKEKFLVHAPEAIRRYWERPRPIEIRPVSLEHYFSRAKASPKQDVWVKAVGAVPDERHLQAAVLAYLSDMGQFLLLPDSKLTQMPLLASAAVVAACFLKS